MLSLPPYLISFLRTNTLSSTPPPHPPLATNQHPLNPNYTKWMRYSKPQSTWSLGVIFLIRNVLRTATLLYQMDRCSKDINILVQVANLPYVESTIKLTHSAPSGLFMGFLVSLILISILYVAISGVASLQVSYAAFDKEMGPAAQKKQTQ
jgi:hypothetical protein